MTERKFDQIEYLREVNSFSGNGQENHLSRKLINYMIGNSFDLRMVSEGGFAAYEHLHSCDQCEGSFNDISAKGY